MSQIMLDPRRIPDTSLFALYNALQLSYSQVYCCYTAPRLTLANTLEDTTSCYSILNQQLIEIELPENISEFEERCEITYLTYANHTTKLCIYGKVTENGTQLSILLPELTSVIQQQITLRQTPPVHSSDCVIVTQQFNNTPEYFTGAVLHSNKILTRTVFELEELFEFLNFGKLQLVYNTAAKGINRKFKKKVEKKLFPKETLYYAKLQYYIEQIGDDYDKSTDSILLLHLITAELFRLQNVTELKERMTQKPGLIAGLTLAGLQKTVTNAQRELLNKIGPELFLKSVEYTFQVAEQNASKGDTALLSILQMIGADPKEFFSTFT